MVFFISKRKDNTFFCIYANKWLFLAIFSLEVRVSCGLTDFIAKQKGKLKL